MSGKTKEKPENRYEERLPEEILKKLTPEVRRQYFLWDEIMKRELQLYPQLILPVVKEIFGREYTDESSITLLSTEYTVNRVPEAGEKLLQAVRSDILMRIAGDLYHFECQIEKDGNMVFRMFEYDMEIALVHGKRIVQEEPGREKKFSLSCPRSAVLYLGNGKSVPKYETCVICFSDGTDHLYRVPVIRVQEYEPERIEEKHLNLLIPFLPVRFQERIRKVSGKKQETEGKKPEETEKLRKELGDDLRKLVSECLTVLDREKENAVITEIIRKDIGEFLWKACRYLLEEDEELSMLVRMELEPAVKLSREIIQELRDSNKELQDSNKELQDNNKELQGNVEKLHKRVEDSYRRLIQKSESEGKTVEETEAELMAVFALTEEETREKIRHYRIGLTCSSYGDAYLKNSFIFQNDRSVPR